MNFDRGRHDRLGDLDLGEEESPESLTKSERVELLEELTSDEEVRFHEAESPLEPVDSTEKSEKELEEILDP